MNEDIKKVGEIFRAKRSEMNLSLKEVENATSIRSSYLEAIEEGNTERTLSSVYTLGFIKQYANYLGLDVDKIMEEHPALFNAVGEKHEFDYGIGTLEMRNSMTGGVKWLPNLLWAGAAALILILAWQLAKYLGLL